MVSTAGLSWIYDLILCKIRFLAYWRSQGLEVGQAMPDLQTQEYYNMKSILVKM